MCKCKCAIAQMCRAFILHILEETGGGACVFRGFPEKSQKLRNRRITNIRGKAFVSGPCRFRGRRGTERRKGVRGKAPASLRGENFPPYYNGYIFLRSKPVLSLGLLPPSAPGSRLSAHSGSLRHGFCAPVPCAGRSPGAGPRKTWHGLCLIKQTVSALGSRSVLRKEIRRTRHEI